MRDEFTRRFFEWVDDTGPSLEDVAMAVGNRNARSVTNWRSEGVPQRKREKAGQLMAEWLRRKREEEEPSTIKLTVSEERYRKYSFAALDRGMILPDWMILACDDAAREKWEPTRRAAEEANPYKSKKK